MASSWLSPTPKHLIRRCRMTRAAGRSASMAGATCACHIGFISAGTPGRAKTAHGSWFPRATRMSMPGAVPNSFAIGVAPTGKSACAALRSGIARLFISTYSTRMRGGYLRFQAQYLRRIRLPLWKDVPAGLKKELIAAAERDDTAACNKAVFKLYRLSAAERAAIGGNGE